MARMYFSQFAAISCFKAFDKVSHNHPLEKLKFYSIRSKTNTWIRDFLSNRRQVVVVDGEKSYEAEVKSGVGV